jgi:hypothetical protein
VLNVPDVSVKIEITNMAGVRLSTKVDAETVSFDAKVKLEERERKSQMVIVGFVLLLTTKPGIVKFDVEGTATLGGKDEELRKMLQVDPETKIPSVLQRIYQHAFTAMYLMSTILNVPPPPQDLLYPTRRGQVPVEGINIQMAAETEEETEGVTIQADPGSK